MASVELTPAQKAKLSKGKCITPLCRRPHIKHRTICTKCKHEREKISNPYGYIYQYVKVNARRRRRPFTLTLPYFKQWCIDNNYLELKGRYKDSMTIDCVIEELGYADGNLQILTNSSNVKKRWVKWRRERDREIPDDYVPPPKEPIATPHNSVQEIAPF